MKRNSTRVSAGAQLIKAVIALPIQREKSSAFHVLRLHARMRTATICCKQVAEKMREELLLTQNVLSESTRGHSSEDTDLSNTTVTEGLFQSEGGLRFLPMKENGVPFGQMTQEACEEEALKETLQVVSGHAEDEKQRMSIKNVAGRRDSNDKAVNQKDDRSADKVNSEKGHSKSKAKAKVSTSTSSRPACASNPPGVLLATIYPISPPGSPHALSRFQAYPNPRAGVPTSTSANLKSMSKQLPAPPGSPTPSSTSSTRALTAKLPHGRATTTPTPTGPTTSFKSGTISTTSTTISTTSTTVTPCQPSLSATQTATPPSSHLFASSATTRKPNVYEFPHPRNGIGSTTTSLSSSLKSTSLHRQHAYPHSKNGRSLSSSNHNQVNTSGSGHMSGSCGSSAAATSVPAAKRHTGAHKTVPAISLRPYSTHQQQQHHQTYYPSSGSSSHAMEHRKTAAADISPRYGLTTAHYPPYHQARDNISNTENVRGAVSTFMGAHCKGSSTTRSESRPTLRGQAHSHGHDDSASSTDPSNKLCRDDAPPDHVAAAPGQGTDGDLSSYPPHPQQQHASHNSGPLPLSSVLRPKASARISLDGPSLINSNGFAPLTPTSLSLTPTSGSGRTRLLNGSFDSMASPISPGTMSSFPPASGGYNASLGGSAAASIGGSSEGTGGVGVEGGGRTTPQSLGGQNLVPKAVGTSTMHTRSNFSTTGTRRTQNMRDEDERTSLKQTYPVKDHHRENRDPKSTPVESVVDEPTPNTNNPHAAVLYARDRGRAGTTCSSKTTHHAGALNSCSQRHTSTPGESGVTSGTLRMSSLTNAGNGTSKTPRVHTPILGTMCRKLRLFSHSPMSRTTSKPATVSPQEQRANSNFQLDGPLNASLGSGSLTMWGSFNVPAGKRSVSLDRTEGRPTMASTRPR